MDEPLDSAFLRALRDPGGSRDMNGMEGQLASLQIKADGIHGRCGPRQGIGNGEIIVNVGMDRFNAGVNGGK